MQGSHRRRRCPALHWRAGLRYSALRGCWPPGGWSARQNSRPADRAPRPAAVAPCGHALMLAIKRIHGVVLWRYNCWAPVQEQHSVYIRAAHIKFCKLDWSLSSSNCTDSSGPLWCWLHCCKSSLWAARGSSKIEITAYLAHGANDSPLRNGVHVAVVTIHGAPEARQVDLVRPLVAPVERLILILCLKACNASAHTVICILPCW